MSVARQDPTTTRRVSKQFYDSFFIRLIHLRVFILFSVLLLDKRREYWW